MASKINLYLLTIYKIMTDSIFFYKSLEIYFLNINSQSYSTEF